MLFVDSQSIRQYWRKESCALKIVGSLHSATRPQVETLHYILQHERLLRQTTIMTSFSMSVRWYHSVNNLFDAGAPSTNTNVTSANEVRGPMARFIFAKAKSSVLVHCLKRIPDWCV